MNKNLSFNMAVYMKRRRVNAYDIATRLKVSVEDVNDWLFCRAYPKRLKHIAQIADILEVRMHQLFEEVGKRI